MVSYWRQYTQVFELSLTVRDISYIFMPMLSDRGSTLSLRFILNYFIAVM